MRPIVVMLALTLGVMGCDPPKPGTPQTTTVEAAPFQIEPTVWGSTDATAKYEVRELPDGSPGLFDGDGRLLLELLPELVVDVGEAGEPRPRPTTRRFELIKLSPNADGGFTLYGRLQDRNAQAYDLRIENGPHDPRIHVGVVAKWARDVEVHRLVVRFATGALDAPRALGHDYQWLDVDGEWVSPLHTPSVVTWGDHFTMLGRLGVENVAVREREGRWDAEVELYHHENHPLEVGDKCGETLDGAARFAAGTRLGMRADIVVGAVDIPAVLRFPEGRRAGVSLVDHDEGATRAFIGPEVLGAVTAGAPAIVARQGVWLGPSIDELPCADGRFQALADVGVREMWSGTTLVSSGANLLAPTETDGRRAFAFGHPDTAVPTLFALSDGEPDAGWFGGAGLAQLKDDRGLAVVRAPLEQFLARDASATQTVRESVASAAKDGAIWLADVGAIASRLRVLSSVDHDFMPSGIVRVRNMSQLDLMGLTLLLPAGTKARVPTGTVHQASGRTISFDLGAGQYVLLQLFRDDQPAWPMRPADITVSFEPAVDPSADAP